MKVARGLADARGAARLAVQATTGLTDLVEAVHQRIARVPGWPPATGPAAARTRGITGFVYRSVRGVTRLVGGSVDGLLDLLALALVQPPGAVVDELASSPERQAVLAALNGVLGDHLAATHNPLALPLCLRHQGRVLTLTAEGLASGVPAPSDRLLVLLHGLCMGPSQWRREGHDHGDMLVAEGSYTAVHVHYNTGLHIGDNGAALALQLEALLAHWPCPLQRVVLLGHSMGGLLARSALFQGGAAGQAWPDRVTDLVSLGTPHHGAPLERAGHGLERLLAHTPYLSTYTAPFLRLTQIRSAGITDLRHGAVLKAESGAKLGAGKAEAPDSAGPPLPPLPPLPPGLRARAVAGVLGQTPGALKSVVLGDGLVPLASALGRHGDPARCLAFAPGDQWVGQNLGHLDLLNRSDVADALRRWLV